jgi:sacsin
MILDPHHAFVEHPGGVLMDVVEDDAAYHDQLAAFSSVIHDEGGPLTGTAFRLPFRTTYQAARSKISDKVTHVGGFREMLRNFVSNDLESVILFLKHITSIEVRRIDPQGGQSVLGKVEIDRLDPIPHSGQVYRKVTLSTEDGTSTRTWCFHNHRIEKDAAVQRMSSRLGCDIGDFLVQEKLDPGVDIAFPLEGPNVKGTLFTLLPLPINVPGSSFHVNAVFALTPDRQNLKKKQEVGDIHSRER